MEQMYILLMMWLVSCNAMAQKAMEKGLATIDRATAEAHIRFLAADELRGRYAGTVEGRVAADRCFSCSPDSVSAPCVRHVP